MIVDIELIERRCLAKAGNEGATLREKVRAYEEALQNREQEVELLQARLEELELNITSQNVQVQEIVRKNKLHITKLKEENEKTKSSYMVRLTKIQSTFAEDMA